MDADERSATLNGKEISLTAREFNLLYKLLSYPQKNFTRTQLMDEFWDANTSPGSRTVDVYMTKLRASSLPRGAFHKIHSASIRCSLFPHHFTSFEPHEA